MSNLTYTECFEYFRVVSIDYHGRPLRGLIEAPLESQGPRSLRVAELQELIQRIRLVRLIRMFRVEPIDSNWNGPWA